MRPTQLVIPLALSTVMGLASLVPSPALASSAAPGSQQWASRYNGPASLPDKPAGIVVSPDGATVYVTGYSWGLDTGLDFATIAYDRSTGAQLWVARYDGAGSPYDDDQPAGIAVSPDGSRVFVTGFSYGVGVSNYATVAYDASSGTQQWVARGVTSGLPSGIAVSPDGATVFVTGIDSYNFFLYDTTIAYDAATGAQRWLSRYTNDYTLRSTGLAVSPDGSRLYVVGYQNGTGGWDVTTLAYDTSDGSQEWFATYAGPLSDYPTAVTVSHDGSRVYVAGYTGPGGTGVGLDTLTIAFDAATGTQVWAVTHNGPAGHDDYANAVAVNPAGTKVYVTGATDQFENAGDMATITYDASTGSLLWLARYDGPGHSRDVANAIAVNPQGTTVYVTGGSQGSGTAFDYATIAYSAAKLQQLWVTRYDGPGHHEDQAVALAVTPDGRAVEATGFSSMGGDGLDFETVSYRA